jgi:hypothetical protein
VSCDWNIKCLDCNDVHTFSDANHEDALMRFLIKYADGIAALGDMFADPEFHHHCIDFRVSYGRIEADWFRKHLGHNLLPIDEYGTLDKQCYQYVSCEFGHRHHCALDAGHDGACAGKART